MESPRTVVTARVPQKLTVILTHRCNQRCEFCFDASSILCASVKDDLTLDVVDRLVGLLSAGVEDPGTFNITLSGGEPTLHRSFLDILARFSDAGFPITILTNGQAFADRHFLFKVLRHRIWNFQISIEGPDAETHDRRVSCPGAFNRILKAIVNVREAGVRFITNTTMTGLSTRQMFALIDLVDSLGVVKMNIGNTLPECAGLNWQVMMQYPTVVEVAEQLNLYALTKKIAFSFITPLPVCLKANRPISNPSVCSAGRYSIVMDPDGTFRPCSACFPPAELLPTVFDVESFADVYARLRQPVAEYVNADVPSECRKCDHFAECRAACPLYWKAAGVTHPLTWATRITIPQTPKMETNRSENPVS
jgi:radical SAM protein with 4Fe4S-binding SPASM domain